MATTCVKSPPKGMRVSPLAIPDVLLVEPEVHADARGFFLETWRADDYAAIGIGPEFVQDNHSRSMERVLRGLHYQTRRPQGKLVRVITGAVFDVAVDLRRSSPTFGRWVGVTLSEINRRQVWIPPGFAHGFLVLSAFADVAYKCTAPRLPEGERRLRWDDPQLAIEWPLASGECPVLSPLDAAAPALDRVEIYA